MLLSTTMKSLAVGLFSGKLTIATATSAAFSAVQAKLNAVMAANPFGVAAAAIGILVTIVGVVISKAKEYKEAAEEVTVAAYDYAGAMEEVTNKSQETINSANTEIAVLKDKVSRYEELREKYSELNEGEMVEFLSLCDDLKEALPESQIDKMKKYHELMIEMRDEGASVSLLQEFSKLDPDDGIQMAEYMLSSGDFEQINELYKERDAIAQQLAEDFYSPEMEALNSSTTDKILDEYSGLPDEFREIGSAAALNLIIGLNEGISDLSDHFALNAETFFDTSGSAIDNLSADDIVLNTDVESGDMLERGRSDGELYAEGFEQGMQGISAEVDISSRQASTAAALNENMLSSIAQKLLDQLKNITIRNVLTAQLECDGKSLAQIVNAETETNRRVADSYG